MDVNEQFKFSRKLKKIGGGGVRWEGGWVGGGFRMDVNALLGVGVMWGIGDVNQE